MSASYTPVPLNDSSTSTPAHPHGNANEAACSTSCSGAWQSPHQQHSRRRAARAIGRSGNSRDIASSSGAPQTGAPVSSRNGAFLDTDAEAGMTRDVPANGMRSSVKANSQLHSSSPSCSNDNWAEKGQNAPSVSCEQEINGNTSVPHTSSDATKVINTDYRPEQPAASTPSEKHTSTGEDPEVGSIKHDTVEKERGSSTSSRVSSKWAKLRTTVKMAGAVSQTKRKRKQSTLDRQDSFLKRFSTRHGGSANVLEEESDDEFEPKVEYFDEDQQTNRLKKHLVINPDENFMFYWLGVLSLAVLYNLWTCIAREAFPEIYDGWETVWIITDALCDVVYLLDIGIQLRTGYLEKGLIVYSSRKLARRYIYSRYFFLDLLSLLPLDLLQLHIGIHPLIRFPRFIKAFRAYRFAFMVETRTIYPNMWRVANLSHVLFLGSHWFAAFYFMISKAENFQGMWGYPKPENEFSSVTRKYLKSLYWSTLTLTTIGDLPPPESNWQYVFTIVSYLIGVFVFATIVGQVGNVITNKNASRQEFERLLDGAKAYMRNHNVPTKMQRRVQRWYDYAWSRGRMNGGGDINSLVLLPDKLKTELALHVNLETLKRVTIFQECEPEFLHDLVLKMRAFIFTPGDLICRKGEVAREMFIIADGLLEVISDSGEVLTQMSAGDFFGEIGILNLDGGVNRRTADVRSVGYSELFVLSRDDVLSALKDHPEAEALIMEFGRKRLRELGDHKRKKLQQKLARKMANSEETSPVHQILNDSADILQKVIAVGRGQAKSYELNEESEIPQHKREGGVSLLGNMSANCVGRERSPVAGLSQQKHHTSPGSRCIANGLKHRAPQNSENRNKNEDVKDPMELVPLCNLTHHNESRGNLTHHNDRISETGEGYSNIVFQRKDSGGTIETPLSEPEEVLIVSSDNQTDAASCTIKVISPDNSDTKDNLSRRGSVDDTDHNSNHQRSKTNTIKRSNSARSNKRTPSTRSRQKDRALNWSRFRKGRSLEIAEAKGVCVTQKMDYLAVGEDQNMPSLSRCRSLPMSIDNSLATSFHMTGNQSRATTSDKPSCPEDTDNLTQELGDLILSFKGIIDRKVRQCSNYYEARIADLEAANAHRESQIESLTTTLQRLQNAMSHQPSSLPRQHDLSKTTRL